MKKIHLFLLLTLCSYRSSAQWKYANYPEGGSITGLAYHNNMLYAGTITGIYTSTDNGNNWLENNTTRTNLARSANDFIFQGNDVFAFAGTLYKSTDQGQNWVQLMAPPPWVAYSAAIKQDTLYVGGSHAFYKSVDGGQTWTNIEVTPFINFRSILIQDTIIYAASDYGLISSTDKAATWKFTDGNYPQEQLFSIKRTGAGFIALSKKQIHTSIDGKDWVLRKQNDSSYTFISMNVVGNKIIACSTKDIFVSEDNGINWTQVIKSPEKNISKYTAVSGQNIFSATYTGVYVTSDNGGNWQLKNKNIKSVDMWAIDQNATTIFTGSNAGLHSSDDDGKTWKRIIYDSSLTTTIVYALAVQNNTIYLSDGSGEGVDISIDNGSSWKHTYLPSFVNILKMKGDTAFAATEDGVFMCTDKTNWIPTDTSNPIKYAFKMSIHNNLIFVSTYVKTLFMSEDGGKSWKNISADLPQFSPAATISDIVTDGNDVVLTLYTHGVYLSSDRGKTWKAIYNKASMVANSSSIIDNRIFVATDWGELAFTEDKGDTWTSINEGLPYNYAAEIIKRKDNYFALTWGSGLWYRPVAEIQTGIDELATTSFQVYPNPNTGSFSLTGLDNGSTVKILNMLGECIYDNKNTNAHIQIDISNQPTGMYLIDVITNKGGHSSQKLIIQ